MQAIAVEPKVSRRIASLDGLRAISIVIVIVSHMAGTPGFVYPSRALVQCGRVGVLVFFVVSGFLITRILISERQRTGRVGLKRFYARRCIRLLPAAYAYIAFVALLTWQGALRIAARDFWHAVTYTMNYRPEPAWQLGHLWTLSVEEQFYLLWPCVFVVLRPRHAIWALVAMMALAPFARGFEHFFLTGTRYEGLDMFPMVCDSLAAGCLLAQTGKWLELQPWYLRLLEPASSAALVVLVFAINRLSGYALVDTLGVSIMNLSLAVLVHRSMFCSNDLQGRFLNWAPVRYLGVLSYSLYLWQELFFSKSGGWITAFPQNIILTSAAALASYVLMEKPLLALRERLRPIAYSGGIQ